jgi:hypothetical protein
MSVTRSGHPAEDALMDLLDDRGSSAARGHVAECGPCQARLGEARAGLDLALMAEVPEPSPFYWQSFRHQVGSRLEAAEGAAPRWRRAVLSPWLAAAAAVIVAVVVFFPRSPAPGPAAMPAAAALLPAWPGLPALEDDEGLDLLAAVVPGASGPLVECQGLGECMGEAAALSDEESVALTEALRRELGADL